MKSSSKKRPQSVLGITLSEGQLRAFHVARTRSGVETVKSATAALTLDILHPEPELVGREIKNHLDAAGIRERNCVVAVPPAWIMSQHTRLPELSAEDVASFLEIEAEKGFPCDPAQLQIARSFHRSGEASYVTQLAVRKEQLDRLANVLKAAGLRPVSFTLGLAALPDVLTPAGKGRVTLAVETKSATLLVSAGGGIAGYRTSESSIDSEAGENVINRAALTRELRITFEQVPADLRRELTQLCLCGEETMVWQLGESLADWIAGSGLTLTRNGAPAGKTEEQIAKGIASHWLTADPHQLEFLPPRPSRWSVMMARYSSKRLATAGFALGALALLAALAFGWQEFRLWRLRSEWRAMEAQVTGLDAVQARIREYRPWYDTSVRNLTILRRVTECFPDNGSVTARGFEVRANNTVSISGTARDNAALLKTLDQLRNAREVQALKVEQIRGKAPAQFTFTFRWNPNNGS